MKTRIFISLTFLFLLVACSQFEIDEVLRRGVRFEQNTLCYSENKRTLDIRFEFPHKLEKNVDFKRSSWILFSTEFESVQEVKEYIVDNFAESADIAFVFHTDEKDPLRSEVHRVSLNYNHTEENFAHQARATASDDPWLFNISFTVPDEFIRTPQTLFGSVIVKHNDIDNYASSKPIIISYDRCCDGTSECPKGFIWDNKNCECISKEEGAVKITPPPPPPPAKPFKPMINIQPLGNGVLSLGSPVSIIVDIDGDLTEAWLYPTYWDPNKGNLPNKHILNKIFKKGQFFFPLCDWTLPELINIDSDFYRETWTPLITDIYQDLENLSGKNNHFALLIQGSADGGTHCKNVSQMTDHESLIYNIRPFCFHSRNFRDKLLFKGQPTYGNPVRNEDLPNLRASFMKWAMQGSIVGDSHIGIIDGKVLPGLNPQDRKVVAYILQTPVDISETYDIYFQ